MEKKPRKTVKPESSDGGAGSPTTGPNCKKKKKRQNQQIHHNFMSWGSVPGVDLKLILVYIEKIALSALNLKVLPGQREVAQWLLQLLEFVTGIDKDEVVGDNCSTPIPRHGHV